jgi:hypothetical protein
LTGVLLFFANRSELQFYDNGTIQLVDRLSQAPLWHFSTGPPISKHITTANSDLSYLIYPMDESDLVEVHNGTGVVCFAQPRYFSNYYYSQKINVSHRGLFL